MEVEMPACLICGKKDEGYLCGSCRQTTNVEMLCKDIISYIPGQGTNQIWDDLASELDDPKNFKNIVFSISDVLPTPRKEYIRALCLAGDTSNVRKGSRKWLYDTYEEIKGLDGLNADELNRIRGLVLGALFMDYRYEDAEKLAGNLIEQTNLPWQSCYNIADFYSKTRRYDEADDAIISGLEASGDNSAAQAALGELKDKNEKYRSAETTGKKEYMPNPKEDKDLARKAYIDFLASIGIEAEAPSKYSTKDGRSRNYPEPIPKDQYPGIKEIRDDNFDTFVAYDLETTGFNKVTDAIIEIGAIKVVNGVISETAEFTFQELVKPFKNSIKPAVTEVTGLTKENVTDARQMWEVTPDFMNFVGDNILVGFNNIRFDGHFLARAGRYSHIVIQNPQFDVWRMALGMKDELGLDKKADLETVACKLNIENPQAHRALADAITTAKVFLKLKEMNAGVQANTVDEILDDLDSW